MRTHAGVTEFPLPVTGAFPSMITPGPDDALWFTLNQANAIGRIDLDGAVILHELPTANAGPVGITLGADPAGGCWFNEWASNRIGHVSLAGEFQHYDLPSPASEPHGIAIGPDGAVWTALETGAAARLAPVTRPT